MADITLSEHTGFGLATLVPLVPLAALAEALKGRAMVLPTSPQQALAYADAVAPDWVESLQTYLAGLAHVVDQSSAYSLLVLSGRDALRLLQKGMPVDLSPASFPEGATVASAIAHVSVVAHHDGPDQFALLIPHSFSQSLRHWLDTTLAAIA